MSDELAIASWPKDRLGEALLELARTAGLTHAAATEMPSPPSGIGVDEWLDSAADCLGFQSKSVDCAFSELGAALRRLGPALVGVDHDTGVRYLAVVRASRQRLRILSPSGLMFIDVDIVKHWIAGSVCEESAIIDACAAVTHSRWRNERLRRQALTEVLSPHTRARRLWTLEVDPGSSFLYQLRRNGVLSALGWTLGLSVLQVVALAYSWVLIGKAALNGTLQLSLIWAWLLLITTAAFMGVGVVLLGNQCLSDVNRLLKARLFRGALRLTTDKIRTRGSGKILAMVTESEILSSVGLTGAFSMAVAVVHLVSAVIVSGLGAGGWVQSALLVIWTACMWWLAGRYVCLRREWSTRRFALSQVALENVLGHLTRIVQQPASSWHDAEDQVLAAYSTKSDEMDHTGRLLSVVPGRGWLIVGLVGLLPTLVAGSSDAEGLALAIGGMLQAHAAMTALASQVLSVSSAVVAWGQVQELFHAAAVLPVAKNPGLSIALDTERRTPRQHSVCLNVRNINFRHDTATRPAIDNCSLSIATGDRILLQGPSGGGKSTLGSLIAGLRTPNAGQIFLWGFDRQSIGDASWRRRILLVPQFHENHIITASLGFNLLMGREWPPSDEALREARQVCAELGLESLIRRMPQRLNQVVGDTGWQLSHGERARVFLARALLQRFEILILDETFAALDAATLQLCMDVVRRRAETLVAIAHP